MSSATYLCPGCGDRHEFENATDDSIFRCFRCQFTGSINEWRMVNAIFANGPEIMFGLDPRHLLSEGFVVIVDEASRVIRPVELVPQPSSAEMRESLLESIARAFDVSVEDVRHPEVLPRAEPRELVDRIEELTDRRCQAPGCLRMLAESCPSDDFCSPRCEKHWRAANIGCELDWDLETKVPDGHPAQPIGNRAAASEFFRLFEEVMDTTFMNGPQPQPLPSPATGLFQILPRRAGLQSPNLESFGVTVRMPYLRNSFAATAHSFARLDAASREAMESVLRITTERLDSPDQLG